MKQSLCIQKNKYSSRCFYDFFHFTFTLFINIIKQSVQNAIRFSYTIYVSPRNDIAYFGSFAKVSFSGVSGDLLRLSVGKTLHKLLFSFFSILLQK